MTTGVGCLRGALFVLLASLLVLVAPAARAQGTVQMQTQADFDTVGVGEVVHLQLSVQSGDGMPTDPLPGATPGFVVRGQSSSPSQTHISINGNRIDRFGLTVDWVLQAQRVGVFSVGPPSVLVSGSRRAARPITIKVVPASAAPHRAQPPQGPLTMPQAPPGFSPFDPWRGLFPGLDPGLDERSGGNTVTTDPKLALDAPRGAFYFLNAVVDSASVAVGQQVTFTVYEYVDETAGASIEVDGSDMHDPAAPEFVKRPLLRDDQEAIAAGYANVGARVWKVSLVRRWALFPLHAGDLVIGPMSVNLLRPRSVAGSKRTTDAIRVHVSEPPGAGRPPGYAVGDVGHFSLSAQVTPRDLEQGGAVGVHVELSGSGNLPASLSPPARTGVEWLTPEVHEQLGNVGHDVFGGRRTFDYVVRVRTAGQVDLGEVSVPFWDPDARRYAVASAKLGTVRVKPSSAAPLASADAPEELLPGLPAARATLEGTAPEHAHVDDRPLFWILGVGAWPAALGMVVAGRATGRRLATSWRARRASPATELKERVVAASAASAGSDARACDAAIARALQAAAVVHAGTNLRGAIGDQVIERLEGAGVGRDAATRVAELLRECESARFAPDSVDISSARDRWQRAQAAIRALEKR